MKAKFLTLKKITSKTGKKYTILEVSNGLRSRELFVDVPPATEEKLLSAKEGDNIELVISADPFKSERIMVTDVKFTA